MSLKDLKTSDEVLGALHQAAAHKPTATETLEQRVSFVYGSVKSNSSITREQVKKVLADETDGTAAA